MKLKELREEAHLTQKQLAEKIGNVQRNISNWENGTSQPDLDTIIKLADIFGVTTDELLEVNPKDIGISKSGNFVAYRRSLNIEDEVDERLIRAISRFDHRQRQALLMFLELL